MKFTGMEKVGELIQLNMLFVLCSLPVVTAGASAAALNYALWRRSEGMGNVTTDFLAAFRKNFRQAAVLWVCVLLLAAGLGLNFWLVSAWTGPAYFPAMVLLVVAAYMLLTWSATVFFAAAAFWRRRPGHSQTCADHSVGLPGSGASSRCIERGAFCAGAAAAGAVSANWIFMAVPAVRGERTGGAEAVWAGIFPPGTGCVRKNGRAPRHKPFGAFE